MFYKYLPTPPGDRMCIPSPVDTDIFRISEENVLDDRRRSANAIRPKLQTRHVM